jgi:uncharacterized protein YcfJ
MAIEQDKKELSDIVEEQPLDNQEITREALKQDRKLRAISYAGDALLGLVLTSAMSYLALGGKMGHDVSPNLVRAFCGAGAAVGAVYTGNRIRKSQSETREYREI